MSFTNPGRFECMRDVVMEKLIHFAEAREEDMFRIREIETRIEYTLMQATVAGKVDVILNDHEGIEIQNYKTSGAVVTEDDALIQIRLNYRGIFANGEPGMFRFRCIS